MKAHIYTKYRSPDVLELKEVEKPAPKDNEVLMNVHAASINVIDYTQEEFTKNGKCYDLILDVKTDRSIFDYRRASSSEHLISRNLF